MSLSTIPATFSAGTAFLGLSPLFFPTPSVHNALATAVAVAPAAYGYGQHLLGEVDANLANAMVGATSAFFALYAAHNVKYLLAEDSVVASNGVDVVQDTIKPAKDIYQGGSVNATVNRRWTVNDAVYIPSRRAVLSALTKAKGMEPARACFKDSPAALTARKVADYHRRAKEIIVAPPAKLENISISVNVNVHVVTGDTKAALVSRFWTNVHANYLAAYDLLDEEDIDQGDFFGVFDIRAGFRDIAFEGSDSNFGLNFFDGSFFYSGHRRSFNDKSLPAKAHLEEDDILLDLDTDINDGRVVEAWDGGYDSHDDGVFSALGYMIFSVLVAWFLLT